jgi:hypothetical protein
MMAPCIERKLAGMGVAGDDTLALIKQRLAEVGEVGAGAARARAVLGAARGLLRLPGGTAEIRAGRMRVALGWSTAHARQLLARGRTRAGELPLRAVVHKPCVITVL